RDDLYYRLNVVPIYLPPLRGRREDIADLAAFFLHRYCEENRRDTPQVPQSVLERLEGYFWPGNVRELENYVERTVVLSHGQHFNFETLIPGNRERKLRSPRERGGGGVDSLIQQL